MNDDLAFERATRDLMDEGSDRTPAATIDAVLLAVRTTPQERDLRIPWRTIRMSTPTRLLAATVLIAVVGVAAINLFGSPAGLGVASTPSPVSTPSAPPTTPSPPAASSAIDTATWVTYRSERYGFSIDHPANWEEIPADHDWTLAADADWMSPAHEAFLGMPGDDWASSGLRVSAWSFPVEPGTTVDGWLEAYCPTTSEACDRIDELTSRASMDGHLGSLISFPEDVQSFFLVDDRIYVVAAWQPGDRDVLEAFLSTMHLLPGGPVPVATASPPG